MAGIDELLDSGPRPEQAGRAGGEFEVLFEGTGWVLASAGDDGLAALYEPAGTGQSSSPLPQAAPVRTP